jgi:F-type H+-transporting ATPase subunit delta
VKARQATAGRYAKALFELARGAGQVEAVERELGAYLAEVRAQPALRDVLLRPWIKPEERRAVAAEVAGRVGASGVVQRFAGLVAGRGRTDHLEEIVTAYRAMADAARGQVRATVRTAVPLTDADRQALAARLGARLGKTVLVEERVDRGLLGGFVAEIGSLVLDGSLDGQLRRMRERLRRGEA